MGFLKQEYWSGFPFPSPRDLPNPEIEVASPALKADSLLLAIGEAHSNMRVCVCVCVCKQNEKKNQKIIPFTVL